MTHLRNPASHCGTSSCGLARWPVGLICQRASMSTTSPATSIKPTRSSREEEQETQYPFQQLIAEGDQTREQRARSCWLYLDKPRALPSVLSNGVLSTKPWLRSQCHPLTSAGGSIARSCSASLVYCRSGAHRHWCSFGCIGGGEWQLTVCSWPVILRPSTSRAFRFRRSYFWLTEVLLKSPWRMPFLTMIGRPSRSAP